MSNYTVRLPFAGLLFIDIEANSEEEAITMAEDIGSRVKIIAEHPNDQFLSRVEWDTYRRIVEGNYCVLNQVSVEVDKHDDEEDEDDE